MPRILRYACPGGKIMGCRFPVFPQFSSSNQYKNCYESWHCFFTQQRGLWKMFDMIAPLEGERNDVLTHLKKKHEHRHHHCHNSLMILLGTILFSSSSSLMILLGTILFSSSSSLHLMYNFFFVYNNTVSWIPAFLF